MTTKLWNNNHRPERVKPALQASINRLGLDTVDQYLVHTPFASLGHAIEPRLLDDPVIVEIAGHLKKSPAQVLLAWGVQRGTAVLTTSTEPERIGENFDISALPESAIQEIDESIDTQYRFNSVVHAGVPGFIPQGN